MIREIDILKQRVAGIEQSELAPNQAEEALRESEERYRTQFEEDLDGICLGGCGNRHPH